MSKTAIIGLGITGLSCLKYLHGRTEVVVVDSRLRPPQLDAARSLFPQVEYRLGGASVDYAGVDQAVVSPGVALDGCLVAPARNAGVRLSSDIDLFCAAAQAPVIAVTGTNGKSTVTALTGHLLGAAGLNVGVGGNLGAAALDLLDDARDAYVLELSSFQLERLQAWRFAAATILNVTEDHMDRHGTMADYVRSKQRIYRACDTAVVNRHDPHSVPVAPVSRVVSFGLDSPTDGNWGVHDGWLGCARDGGFSRLLRSEEVPLGGRHNAMNVLAALALATTDPARQQLHTMAGAVASFAGLPHRCQPIGEIAGVSYVDDSKATNVGAAVAALEGMGNPERKNLVLIAGGDGKGADFAPLFDPVARLVKGVVLMGKDADALHTALTGAAPLVRVGGLVQAVQHAQKFAGPGDVVLLSPACASLDMFENFADRGRQFASAVKALDGS